jgi:ATP-dependent DNA helicase DinG
MFSWPRGLPRPSHIVVDEAHKIEDEATKAFSIEVSQENLEGLLNQLVHMQGMGSLFYLLAQTESVRGESSETIQKLKTKAEDVGEILGDHLPLLAEKVERYFKKMPRYTEIYWNELPMLKKENVADTLTLALFNHLESIHFSLGNLYKDLVPFESKFEGMSFKEDARVSALTRFRTFLGFLEDLFSGVQGLLELKEGMTHSMKFHKERGYLFLSSPIDIGKFLHEGLLNNSSSVVFTSATLANAEGDKGVKGIEWATGYSYLEPNKRFKEGTFLPAVFNYREKTKVLLCDDTHHFGHVDFVKDTMEILSRLVREIDGGALFLFSAKKRFEVAAEILLEKFEGEIPLFIQGMGNNVVEDFKKEVGRHKKGLLIGMESFGEGIDIPGKDLQFIFIDKIPDMRMDLVIKERRDFYQKNFGNEFTDYYLSHRTRSLHQKLGRLLRTENDRGGVIIVDSRVKKWKGPTMEKVKKLMEPYNIERMPIKEACEEIKKFLTPNL